ncbi:MAG: YdeI/OmpD-associated family protein [Methanomassiliicoccales archaeon]|nr:YdeI/OmpD-associated family protein [Methanomassiliicoccales archaeon]
MDFESPAAWKSWLEENHHTSPGVWLVFWKKSSGKARITHRQALEEALCYGWIDSLIHKLDEHRYAIVFTPRRPGSVWSEINLNLVRRLTQEGRMRQEGLDKVDWSQEGQGSRRSKRVPEELASALAQHPAARRTFDSLTEKQMEMHIHYVMEAKRPETRRRRADNLIRLFSQGKKLGNAAEAQNR